MGYVRAGQTFTDIVTVRAVSSRTTILERALRHGNTPPESVAGTRRGGRATGRRVWALGAARRSSVEIVSDQARRVRRLIAGGQQIGHRGAPDRFRRRGRAPAIGMKKRFDGPLSVREDDAGRLRHSRTGRRS